MFRTALTLSIGLLIALFAILDPPHLAKGQMTMMGVGTQVVQSGGGGGTPATIFGANLYAWYYADRGGVSPSSGTLTSATDQSGNGHTLNTIFGAPTVSATSFHGQPGVTFADNSGDSARSGNANVGTTTMSFFILYNDSSAAVDGDTPLSYCDNGGCFSVSYGVWSGLVYPTTSRADSIYNGNNASNTGSWTVGDTCLGVVLDTAHITQYRGTSQTAQATGNTAPNTLGNGTTVINIGGNFFANSLGMTWAELVVVNTNASAGQISSLISYFNSHWGVSC
jgi:hypothetical protein